MPENKKAWLADDIFGKPEQAPTRNGYGEGLIEAGEKDENVVILCADLTDSTRSGAFKERFPDRFFEAGITEQSMASVAAGMSLMGKVPFISSYAMFSPGRNWEQIRTTICYNEANVKIAGAHAGISVGPDGATHQAIEDIAITRVLPNMIVIAPCDSIETRKATIAAAKHRGPVYIRFARAKSPIFTTEKTPFEIGKAQTVWDGSHVGIISCGIMVHESLKAAKELEKQGISARVINCHTIKPLDKDTILKAAQECGALVTVEEHQQFGGLGSAISELVSEHYPVPTKKVGVKDHFGESGTPDELLDKFGLRSKNIIAAVKEVIKVRKACKQLHAPEVSVPKGRKLVSAGHPELTFKVHDGRIVQNVPELKQAIKKMSEETFSHHVNSEKNDFSTWIKDVFKDEHLAEMIAKCKTKKEAISMLRIMHR